MRANVVLPSRRQVATALAGAATALALPMPLFGQSPASGNVRGLRAQDGGFGGATPGPLIRVKRGEELRVRLSNGLPKSTAVHWHGVRVPNILDGVPFVTQQPLAPGGTFDFSFIPPDAGTFWYHAAFVDQLDDGLYGPLIVDEPARIAVDRDIVLMIGQSVSLLNQDGSRLTEIAVKTNERLRLRLINARSAEVVAVWIEGHRATVMAIDGQPAEPFIANEGRVVLGPGNRLDLFIDATLSPGTSAPLARRGDSVVARIVYDTGPPARPAPLPEAAPLPPNPLPEHMSLATAYRREINLGAPGGWISAIRPADTPIPMFSVARGRTVTLALNNPSEVVRMVHVHGHSFRLLDRLDDGWKPFWLDTLVVPPGEVARIAFVADNRGTWAIENRPLVPGDGGRLALFDAA